ncbi:PIG-L deacetylase family protein [Ectothiorhodospira lacustris]|uniref:PIG-L deacetylase family protein n=1 Tax=Ectothiorhodospira lacustris TaxID=2899127 RepID=UPI001EE816A5|nr:PIG-L deacetylase family protein [Ectothiorhodospira lacustris]MCG5501464.1 PIG-L family deacetylase [Ectothiorhodospira lacustris]
MIYKNVLIIAAHPDDESIGAGGTLARWASEGVNVHTLFIADGVGSRHGKSIEVTELKSRRRAAKMALDILGLTNKPTFFDFPDNKLDTIPLLKIVQSIEFMIQYIRPDTVLTHHAGDLNIDHRRVHQAVLTACRPQPGHPVRQLLFFEVASSTEWQTPGSGPTFMPNVFIDISDTMDRKRAALSAYEYELRPWPHARSIDAVEHLARWRGASVGVAAAEAFMLGRLIQ